MNQTCESIQFDYDDDDDDCVCGCYQFIPYRIMALVPGVTHTHNGHEFNLNFQNEQKYE